MPYIRSSEVKTLIEVEDYLGCKEGWSEMTEKVWSVVENIVQRQARSNQRTREYIAEKRKTNKNYAR